MSKSSLNAFCNAIAEAHDHGCCFIPETKGQSLYARRMARRGKLIIPLKGMYALPEVWSDLDKLEQHAFKCRSLALKHPYWVFCHASAASLYGLYISHADLREVHVACCKGSYSRSSDQIRRHYLADIDEHEHEGMPVTSVLQTAYDCMRSMSFQQGLAVADSVLRFYGYTREDLVSYIERHRNLRGHAGALEAANHADGASESGGESIARARMIELGFEVPKLQVELDDPLDLGREYRADFLWELDDGTELIGELDGHEKYTNVKMTEGRDIVEVLIDERNRESRVSAYKGRRVMRFSYAEMMNSSFFELLLDTYGVPRA